MLTKNYYAPKFCNGLATSDEIKRLGDYYILSKRRPLNYSIGFQLIFLEDIAGT